MEKILGYFFAKENKKNDTDFSRFFREGSSSEKKKVFLNVAKKATLDQQKIMGR